MAMPVATTQSIIGVDVAKDELVIYHADQISSRQSPTKRRSMAQTVAKPVASLSSHHIYHQGLPIWRMPLVT